MIPLIFACKGGKQESTDSEAAKAGYSAKPNIVETIVLKKENFDLQVISNGKLRATRKSELSFRADGVIDRVLVKNGQTVSKGDAIAFLDKQQAMYLLDAAKQKMEKSKLDFADAIIGYGYGKDTSKVPKDLLEITKIRTGYSNAVSDLSNAENTLKNTALQAPFDGKIANLTKKAFESSSGIICTLIDDSRFETDFNLLESEISFVKIGSSVLIVPFSNPEKQYRGVVSQINPLVDDKGQIKIMASVSNVDGKLLEGMNVKVYVENRISGKLVVPKSAVVMRDNFDVLFRLDKSTGKAMWTYVTVEFSNTGYHAVIANKDKNAELNEGDIVIVSGNLNLADGSNVEIKSK